MPESGVCLGLAPRGLMLEITAHAHPHSSIQEECFDKRVQHFTKVVFVFISRFRTGWSSCWFLIGTTPPLPL